MRINSQIRAKKVRLVNEEGEQAGILSREEALRIAQEKGQDLVEVAPQADPPVCRILDYGKYKYQQEKRKKKAKKKSVNTIKEVRLSYRIGEHDFEVKVRKICKFLKEGYRVKLSLRFKGREMIYQEQGKKILERASKEIEEVGKAETSPSISRRVVEQYLVPKLDK
ncbi:translation initiation factor IF-3 [Candidatus Aerophobetes bacterium Ae_b3a]|nr:MAG: translation initiation factor IF-3 [Candidatus Aerophobetes bacterium Ae_b3a]